MGFQLSLFGHYRIARQQVLANDLSDNKIFLFTEHQGLRYFGGTHGAAEV